MSKPLDLTVYLPDDYGDYEHPVYGFWVQESDVDHHTEAKRFTDAELASITWHLAVSYFVEDSGEERRARARENMIAERFATLPHYDEVTA